MCLKYVLPQKNDKEPTARISDIWEITREKTCHFSHLVKQKRESAILCESAYKQDLPAMQKLIIKGGSPNTQDHQGNSLLHLSIQKVLEYYKTGTKKSTHQELLDQGIDCIQFLLESKANPQILNHKKLTVHEIAAQSGDVLATQRVANLIRHHRQNNSLEGKMEKLHLN